MGRTTTILLTLCMATTALSGCLLGMDEEDETPARSATILADWLADGQAFVVRIDGPPPTLSSLALRVMDLDSGVESTLAGSAWSVQDDGSFRVAGVQGIEDGHRYRVVVAADDVDVGSRTFTVSEDPDMALPGFVGGATYSVSASETKDSSDETFEMRITGTLRFTSTADIKRESVSATGSMDQEADDFVMELEIVEFETTEENAQTVASTMQGTGTWRSTAEGAQGGGDIIQFASRFETVEDKEDADGVTHSAERFYTIMEMDGLITISGQTYEIYAKEESWEWTDRETRDVVWVREEGYTRLSSPTTGTVVHEEPSSYEGAPIDEEDAEPSLGEAVALTGPIALPVTPGDVFYATGVDGVEGTARVTQGTSMQAGGVSFETYEVATTLTSGASGTQAVVLAAGGAHDGLLLKLTADYTRGTEAAQERVNLISLQ